MNSHEFSGFKGISKILKAFSIILSVRNFKELPVPAGPDKVLQVPVSKTNLRRGTASSCRQPTATGIVSCCGCIEASDRRETTRGLRRQLHVKPKRMYIYEEFELMFSPQDSMGRCKHVLKWWMKNLKNSSRDQTGLSASFNLFNVSAPQVRVWDILQQLTFSALILRADLRSPVATSIQRPTEVAFSSPWLPDFLSLADEGVGDQIGSGDGDVVFCVSDGATNEIRWVYPA